MSHVAKNSSDPFSLNPITLAPLYTAELVEAVKVALTTNILRVTINKPIARLPPVTRPEKKQKQNRSSSSADKDPHNPPLPPQPLPAKAAVTEKKMETVGLSEKPPVTEVADRKDPPQWFVEHMDKVGCLQVQLLLLYPSHTTARAEVLSLRSHCVCVCVSIVRSSHNTSM